MTGHDDAERAGDRVVVAPPTAWSEMTDSDIDELADVLVDEMSRRST